MTNTTQDLQLLLDALREGDPAALDQLIERAMDRLRKLASLMLGDDRIRRFYSSDDVFQEASMSLAEALRRDPPENVIGFMYLSRKILRNAITSFARKEYGPLGEGRNRQSNALLAGDTSHHGYEPVANDTTPSEHVARDEARLEFRQALSELPEDDFELFDLLFVYELPQAEVADLLGYSVRTVRNRWTRVRVRLGKTLKEMG